MKANIFFLFFIIGISTLAQNNAIFEKLDFNKPQLEIVKKLHVSGNEQQALKALFELYQKKENLYLKVSETDAKYINSTYPKEVTKTLKTANDVLNQYFLFRDDWDMEKTNIPYQFKNEIDWKAMPNGDEEWCYMLNRHKYWIDLGKAYLLTGNEKYAKGFVKQVTHWIANNPLDDSLKNYSWRRIEAGIRCENWIKSFEYVKKSKSITPAFLSKFLESLYQQGVYINSAFSGFSQTSNWGVLEYQGLFNLSLFLDDFKIAPQWQTDAIDKLTTCINLQILEDGTQWEQSPMYHNEVFHCYMNVNLLSQQKGIKLPEVLVQKTKEMAYANVKWQKPNYHQPLLGDSDDTDLRGLLTLAASIFNDPVLKSRAFNTLDYETLFITGMENNKIYENIPSKFPDFLSAYQQSSGDFYMRSSWEADATYTSFHLKKLGCGHGHDNLLHFTIFANGRDYLIDGGRFSYVDNEWREFFKNNKSHNTLGVDDLTNSIYKDSWLNTFEARSQGVYTKITTDFDYAEAENTAYKRLADPVFIKRRMLYLKPDVWLVFDSFSANGNHAYAQYFNFPNKNIQIENEGLTTTYADSNLRIQPIKASEIKLSDAWWSSEYNLKEETKRAEIFKQSEGFTSFITLLYFPDKTNLKYEKTPVYDRADVLLKDADVEAVNLYIDDKTYTLLVVHNSPAPAAHFFKVNGQIVNGEVVLIEKSENQNSIHIIKD
ncbi:alginate lyase family protein [Mariniflexile maritimum]|uniref:alginate lyase family protein n=1 Tax=Mariniflexile maritimum TaxID=2682493 RepID=UPI0012F6524E|nr:alginate lyase family protein [Mariniflexile maritimum]